MTLLLDARGRPRQMSLPKLPWEIKCTAGQPRVHQHLCSRLPRLTAYVSVQMLLSGWFIIAEEGPASPLPGGADLNLPLLGAASDPLFVFSPTFLLILASAF